MVGDTEQSASDWRTVHGDSSGEEWALIADLVLDFSGPGKIGRPPLHRKREIVDATMRVIQKGVGELPEK